MGARSRSVTADVLMLLRTLAVAGTALLSACADAATRNPALLAELDTATATATATATPPAPVVAPRVAKPDTVKALYLNAWAAGSPTKLTKLIAVADSTEINSFVIDVKEAGEISYESQVPLARESGANRAYIRNIRSVLARLHEKHIYPIARIVVFKDAVLAEFKPEFAVKDQDGSIWRDDKGKAWVDTYNRAVWDYNIALAREAVELGFSEVQWDYVRFSDAPRSYLARATYPAAAGRAKADAVREFMLYARDKLKDLNVPVTADVFGLTVTTLGDMGIGQQWEKMADAVDVILPMVYPSHFITGNYGLRSPNAAPYKTVKRSMTDAIRRSQAVPNAAKIRPWLQAFTLGPPKYGPAHVRAQIEAVYDAGLTEWVLWSPGSNYDPAALASIGRGVPEFDIPGGKDGQAAPVELPKTTEKEDSALREVLKDTIKN
ncbi:MAG: putative glycoside hydrolase [Gemmatimonadota bacterium]